MASTWLIEWRIFSSWGLSLVLGSSTGVVTVSPERLAGSAAGEAAGTATGKWHSILSNGYGVAFARACRRCLGQRRWRRRRGRNRQVATSENADSACEQPVSSLGSWRVSLVHGLAGEAVISASSVQASDDLSGVGVSIRLYSINIRTQTERQLSLSVDPGDKLANGVAVKPSRVILFVMEGSNNLRIWRDGADTLDIVTTPEQLSLDDHSSTSADMNAHSAAYFDDTYCLVPRNSNGLNRVNLADNGKFISRLTFRFQAVPGEGVNHSLRDIATNPLDGCFYAATSLLNSNDIARSTTTSIPWISPTSC
jgi:hypothetical protein